MNAVQRSETASWLIGAGVALAVHAAAGFAIWGSGPVQAESGGPSPVMIAMEVTQTGVETPMRDAAPGEMQTPAEARSPVHAPLRAPVTPDGEMALAAPRTDEDAEIARTDADATTAPQPATGAEIAPASADGASTGDAAANYQARLRAHLERNKRYPRAARAHRQQGVVLVVFSMRRDGSVISARIAGGSGHSLLDAEVLALIERAQPMPIPSDQLAGTVLEFTAPVEFYLR